TRLVASAMTSRMTAGASVQVISRRVLPWVKTPLRRSGRLRYLMRNTSSVPSTRRNVMVVIQKIHLNSMSIESPWVEYCGGSQYFHSPGAARIDPMVDARVDGERGVTRAITYGRSFGRGTSDGPRGNEEGWAARSSGPPLGGCCLVPSGSRGRFLAEDATRAKNGGTRLSSAFQVSE